MPIRIRKDKDSSNTSQKPIPKRNSSSGNSGGGSGIGGSIITALLPTLIGLFRKNPKVGLIVLGVGLLLFFVIGRGGCSDSTPNSEGFQEETVVNEKSSNPTSSFTGDLFMDEAIYDKAEVYAPLANNAKNPLPESVSLLKYCPKRMNQGSQGSCVGWASAYSARTILYARQSGKDPNDVKFSPSYLYNQIALKGCQGSYLNNAMEVMKKGGVAPYSKFAYSEKSCTKQPPSDVKQLAANFKTKGFNRLSVDGDNYKTDLLAIKQNLAQGAPVVIGMMVGGTFMSKMNGKSFWKPTDKDYDMSNFGGHAMCVIGYDDYKEGGAFQIMNSWGEAWGSKGIFWIRYNDFEYFTREAYGLYPMGDSEKYDTQKMSASIGLIYNNTGKNIDLNYQGGITFKTNSPIKKGTDFKVEVTNDVECYVYVFGEEIDKSNYVLFPYTAKHSPYCGITGTRVFPNDYSMYADTKGETDRIAVIVSKQPIDYKKLSKAITNAAGVTYEQKVKNALSGELISNVDFKGGKTFSFKCNTGTKNAVAAILEFDKN